MAVDVAKLERIADNLIRSAIKHTPAGQPHPGADRTRRPGGSADRQRQRPGDPGRHPRADVRTLRTRGRQPPRPISGHRHVWRTEQIDNISEACRAFDISRTTFYDWQERADRYGLDALWPRERRGPVQPNAMAPWEVQTILAEAIARPTLGARRLMVHLAERGVHRSASGVQKVLRRHNLGRREQRLGLLAQATAVAGGPVTEAAIDDLGREGAFCHCAPFAGDLVALDSFYVGKLKGVGTVWQFTAIDTATRWAIAELTGGGRRGGR